MFCVCLCVGCWGGFCCFVALLVSPFFLSIAFDGQGRHPSKTVTIVMMSAAQEQKKNCSLLGAVLFSFRCY